MTIRERLYAKIYVHKVIQQFIQWISIHEVFNSQTKQRTTSYDY